MSAFGMDLHGVQLEGGHLDTVKAELCQIGGYHQYSSQHLQTLHPHPANAVMPPYSHTGVQHYQQTTTQPGVVHDSAARLQNGATFPPYPPPPQPGEMLFNGKLYPSNSGYPPLAANNMMFSPTTATVSSGTTYGHRGAMFGAGAMPTTGFGAAVMPPRQDRAGIMFSGPYPSSSECANRTFEMEVDTSGYRSNSAGRTFSTRSGEYSPSVMSGSMFGGPGMGCENYASSRMTNSFTTDAGSLNRTGTVSSSPACQPPPSCETSRKSSCDDGQSSDTARRGSETLPSESARKLSATESSSVENTTVQQSSGCSPSAKSVQSQPQTPVPTPSNSDGKPSESSSSKSDEEQLKSVSEDPPVRCESASESVNASKESDSTNVESDSVQPECSSSTASQEEKKSPHPPNRSSSTVTNETPSSTAVEPMVFRPELTTAPLQPDFPRTFPSAPYFRPTGPVPASEAFPAVVRAPGPFLRPCIPGPHPPGTFLHPNGTVIQTNGTFVPPPPAFCRLPHQINATAVSGNGAPILRASPPVSLPMALNGTASAMPRPFTTAEVNAMEVSALNRMMGIVLPKNKGNSHLKREWRNVGWFTSEAEMNAVRKRQKVSKWKSVDQISGLKVFFRCNKWKRTNCNYRMFVMYYAMDRISLNESGEHDHSALYVDGKSRDDDTPPPAAARAVFEATPSSSQQRVLDQLIMNATANASLASTSSFEGENVFETGSSGGDGINRPKSSTPSQSIADSEENGSDSSYHLSDGHNIAELLQVAADMDLTFTFNSRRTCEYCFESNAPEMKGRMIVFSDMGGKVAVAERHNGVERG
ncbi:unnamed protein product [Toxocara canis]|uniref:Zinc finger protein n=1 Tax=Toxocara canis TaxID=6265 RepID=A0A183V174_TOXCA|nr:unnamed protein product [Toxocara canis]